MLISIYYFGKNKMTGKEQKAVVKNFYAIYKILKIE